MNYFNVLYSTKSRILVLFLLLGFFVLSISTTKAQVAKIDRLEKLLEVSKNDSTKVAVLNALYEEYSYINLLTAKTYAEKALRISKNAKLIQGTVLSLNNLAKALNREGIPKKSIELYKEAITLQDSIKDQKGKATTLNSLGNIYMKTNSITEAIKSYKAALHIREKINDKKGVSVTLTNLGSLYYRQKNYVESYNYYHKARKIAKAINEEQISNYNLLRESEALLKQRQYQQALRNFKSALRLAQEKGYCLHIQQAYQGLSETYAGLGDYKKAYDYHELYVTERVSYLSDKQNRELFRAETEKKQSQTQLLLQGQKDRLEEAEKKRTIEFRTTLALIFAIAFVVILILSLFLYLINRKVHKTNQLLTQKAAEVEKKSQELERKSNELESQKQQVQNQKDAIDKKNTELDKKNTELDKKNTELERKNIALEVTFEEIERKNKDITASINYAQRIQEAMLPLPEQISATLPEHFILFKPRDIVSGDFYWFAEIDNKAIIAAADCTGHGVPGAIMSMIGNDYLTQIIELQRITSPDTILYQLHSNIRTALQQDKTKNQDGMDIAVCVVDKTNKVLEYAGASSPLTYVKNEVVEQLQSGKLPIGGFQKDRERVFEKHSIKLDAPITFYMHSDGYQDQFGGPKGRKFAKKRLKNLLYDVHSLDMLAQKEKLDSTLREWMGENRQMDDVIVIGVRVNPDDF